MSRNTRFVPGREPLDDLCMLSALGPVSALLTDVIGAAQAAVPDEVPALLDAATRRGAVGVIVETQIDTGDLIPLPLMSAPLLPSDVVGLIPPVQTELVRRALEELYAHDPTGLIPPIDADLLAYGLQLEEVGLTEPQRIGVVFHDVYPADADIYIGFARIPDTGTFVPVGFLPLLDGNLGVTTDAIEADLGGAGLEV